MLYRGNRAGDTANRVKARSPEMFYTKQSPQSKHTMHYATMMCLGTSWNAMCHKPTQLPQDFQYHVQYMLNASFHKVVEQTPGFSLCLPLVEMSSPGDFRFGVCSTITKTFPAWPYHRAGDRRKSPTGGAFGTWIVDLRGIVPAWPCPLDPRPARFDGHGL